MAGAARTGTSVEWDSPLTRDALGSSWPRLAALADGWRREGAAAGPVRFDVSKAPACDGAGLAALLRIGRAAADAGRTFSVTGLTPRLEEMLRSAVAAGTAAEAAPSSTSRDVSGDRRRVRSSTTACGALEFVGELSVGLLRPAWFRAGTFSRAFAAAGPGAVGVSSVVGFLLGLVLAFESAAPLKMFGAEIYVANLIGVAVVRELAILVAAVVMAGRTASAFAAELATMESREETDALRALGIPLVRYLAVPRVAAAAVALPLLSFFAGLAALAGGGLVISALGYGWHQFWSYAMSFCVPVDVATGAVKAVAFGALIGGVGCQCGLSSGAGAEAVGRAVTRAVVFSIIAVAAADGVFAAFFRLFGI